MDIHFIVWALLGAIAVVLLVTAGIVIAEVREQFTGDGSEERLKDWNAGNISQGEEVPDE